MTNTYFRSLFYLGLLATPFFLYKVTTHFYKWLKVKVRSFFNAKKYLNSKIESPIIKKNNQLREEISAQRNDRYYAAIYGANNKAGKIFANFLAD